jgi:hypothetical protein
MKVNTVYILGVIAVIIALVFSGCAAPLNISQDTDSGQYLSTTAGTADDQNNPSEIEGVVEEDVYVVSAGSVSSIETASTGPLQIRVTDAPAKEEITAIEVTVSEILIHKAVAEQEQEQEQENEEGGEQTQVQNENEVQNADNGDWLNIDIDPDNNTFDLLVVKEDPKTLALAFPEVGKYTQIRMVVESAYVTFGEGDEAHTEEAFVPSGTIKFVRPFEITSTETTDLLFDFDAGKSVNVTGNGKVIFKPVIKLAVDKCQKPDGEEEDDRGKDNNGNGKDEADDETEGVNITTSDLAEGEIGTVYEIQLEAEGGTAPYKWSLIEGELPEGLSLSEDGILSGTAAIAGEYEFVVKVEDSSDPVTIDEEEFELEIEEAENEEEPNVTGKGGQNKEQ